MESDYILIIDVGKGTEDILLIKEQDIENLDDISNSIQLVVPSTAQLLKDHLTKIHPKESILFTGYTMAGEPWNKIIYRKCQLNPETVFMTEQSALSLKYDLDFIKSKGIIIEDDNFIERFAGD